MTDPNDISEILVAPLGAVLRRIGEGVASAQAALDSAAISQQDSLQTTHPALAAIGYQVTWYQMPAVEVELKMAIHFEQPQSGAAKFFLAPFNAKYQSGFKFQGDGASSIKFRVVPIPPPIRAPDSQA